MAKVNTVKKEEVVATAVVVKAPLYTLGKLPRNGLTGDKFGVKGNQGTYSAICDALKHAPNHALDLNAIMAVAAGLDHKGFTRYAIRNHWLLPVEAKA